MASQTDIEVVKINVLEDKYPQFTDAQIGAMLDANKGSIPYVSYKIAILKSDNQAVSIGPISLENNTKFWEGLANVFLAEYEEAKRADAESYGGTLYMKRADETW